MPSIKRASSMCLLLLLLLTVAAAKKISYGNSRIVKTLLPQSEDSDQVTLPRSGRAVTIDVLEELHRPFRPQQLDDIAPVPPQQIAGHSTVHSPSDAHPPSLDHYDLSLQRFDKFLARDDNNLYKTVTTTVKQLETKYVADPRAFVVRTTTLTANVPRSTVTVISRAPLNAAQTVTYSVKNALPAARTTTVVSRHTFHSTTTVTARKLLVTQAHLPVHTTTVTISLPGYDATATLVVAKTREGKSHEDWTILGGVTSTVRVRGDQPAVTHTLVTDSGVTRTLVKRNAGKTRVMAGASVVTSTVTKFIERSHEDQSMYRPLSANTGGPLHPTSTSRGGPWYPHRTLDPHEGSSMTWLGDSQQQNLPPNVVRENLYE